VQLGAVFALVAVVYAALSVASYDVFGALTIGVTFFPPAGLTLAAFILLRPRLWPAVALAIVVAEITVDLAKGNGLWWSMAWAAANLTEPLIGALVVRRLTPSFELMNRRFALAFTIGGLVVGPAFGAAIGATTLTVVNDLEFLSAFGHIWVGDGLGALVIAPAIIAAARPPGASLEGSSRYEVWLLLGLFGALAVAFFTTDEVAYGYAAIPLLVWPAARFGPPGIALAAVGIATLATSATAHSTGPWAATEQIGAQAQLGNQQAFLLAVIGAAWLLAIEAAERRHAVRTREVVTERWESEHEVALALQRALMPPTVASTDTTRAAGMYLPAPGMLQVGGDWYEVITTTRGDVALLVGDVVGHGLAAATAMGKLSSAARALAYAEVDPAALIQGIDRVAKGMPDARMATMACAILDVPTGHMRYSVAGHPPPLVRRPDGSVIALEHARGLPLATGFPRTRRSASIALEPGSLVVLYTDGLVERRDTSLDARMDQLAATVQSVDPADPAVACETIVTAMLSDREQADDVAVLCLAIEPVRRFRHTLRPDPLLVAPLRHEFMTWLSRDALDTRDGIDVLLAVGEAVNNAVEHAHDGNGGSGTITVDATLGLDGILRVSVHDDGVWRPPHSNPLRGRGFAIMRATCDVECVTDSRGTTVTLARHMRSAPDADADGLARGVPS
jgi:serine phosphatase RsbU (regulator of sigma subunit)/integral membrane sensor domain MASE1/anti-sigma regulatory factor (Ser/Thr protein kinase)